jgi:hypothetical protein
MHALHRTPPLMKNQTKHNAAENPKDCTQRQFVSAEQKEGDQGVPTPQSKGRENGKATAAHSIRFHSSAPSKKRATKVYLHCKAKAESKARRPPHTASAHQHRAKKRATGV